MERCKLNATEKIIQKLKARELQLKNDIRTLQKQNETEKPQMQKFEEVKPEIPIRDLSHTVSSQRRILSACVCEHPPEETMPIPENSSPTQSSEKYEYPSLTECEKPGLALPYKYSFLAEIFRCVDMISAKLFNRKELITFSKLKPAVQELLCHNFTRKHLAQIKTIYPDAYTYHQEKYRNFDSVFNPDKYELVLTPVVEINGRNYTPDADNILKTTSENSMNSIILLKRRKKFYKALLETVNGEHERFLILGLERPRLIDITGRKLMRWHPEFDVESCKDIEQATFPPYVEKPTAEDVLDTAVIHMERALRILAAME